MIGLSAPPPPWAPPNPPPPAVSPPRIPRPTQPPIRAAPPAFIVHEGNGAPPQDPGRPAPLSPGGAATQQPHAVLGGCALSAGTSAPHRLASTSSTSCPDFDIIFMQGGLRTAALALPAPGRPPVGRSRRPVDPRPPLQLLSVWRPSACPVGSSALCSEVRGPRRSCEQGPTNGRCGLVFR